MKRLVILLSLLSILLSGCKPPVDPGTLFNPDSYLLKGSQEVDCVRDVTRAEMVLVIWFWTECPHCQAEMQSIQNEYERLQNVYKLEVVGVSVWSPREDVSEFVRNYKIKFPVVVDHGNPPATGVPFIRLIENGKVMGEWLGAVPLETILVVLDG